MKQFKVENIGIGFLGNGNAIWDRTIEERGDYKTVAFVQGKLNTDVGLTDDITIRIHNTNPKYDALLEEYLRNRYVDNFVTEIKFRP